MARPRFRIARAAYAPRPPPHRRSRTLPHNPRSLLVARRPALEAAPETFVSEADVERVLKTATKLVNSTLRSAYSLALGDCTPLVLK
eukprot:522627-Prymnesium_polylepis.1